MNRIRRPVGGTRREVAATVARAVAPSVARVLAFVAVFAAALASGACSKDSTPPLVATSITTSVASISFDALGATQQVLVIVRDQNGETMSNVSPTFTSDASAVATVSSGASPTVTAVGNGNATITVRAGSASASIPVTVAQVPVAPIKVSGDGQVGRVGTALGTALRVKLQDRLGNVVVGRAVTFTPAAGNGAASPAGSATGVDGTASTTWTIGTVAGAQSLAAATTGVAEVATFSATGTAGTPATVTVSGGNNQSATVGTAVATALAVRVADAYGNPVPGASVVFAAAAGSGSVTGSPATTNALGIATAATWTLGTVAGVKTVTASVAGVAPVTFTATATPGPPAVLTVVAGAGQSATVGTALSTSLAVRVADSYDNPVAGASVTFAASTGSGSISGSPAVTNSLGIATAGTWTLGTLSGVKTIVASVGGVAPLNITAIATATAPASLVATGGDLQTALAGAPLGSALAVTVKDQYGNGVPNVLVTFQATAGGGTITPATATSDASGVASGVTWRLGNKGGPQTASATGSGFSVSFTATVQSTYPLDLRFYGPPMSLEAQTAFTNAANRLRAAIVSPVSAANLANVDLSTCGVSGLTGRLTETSQGVIIYAAVAPIDGSGQILAQAGPCFVRTDNSLPVVGVMEFDVADIANYINSGRFEGVVLHEMNHVVGLGTVWADKGLLANPAYDNNGVATGSTNPRFMGAAATANCLLAGGTGLLCTTGSGVAVEAGGGAGTGDSHWRESLFDTELMTGYAEGTPNMPWSTISIGSFQDLGYTVNLLAADAYTVPNLLALARMRVQAESLDGTREVVRRPRFEVTSDGRVRPIPRERK